jgi:hypothetical protein
VQLFLRELRAVEFFEVHRAIFDLLEQLLVDVERGAFVVQRFLEDVLHRVLVRLVELRERQRRVTIARAASVLRGR